MFRRSLYITEASINIVHRVCLFTLAVPLLHKSSSNFWPQRLRCTICDTSVLGAWLNKFVHHGREARNKCLHFKISVMHECFKSKDRTYRLAVNLQANILSLRTTRRGKKGKSCCCVSAFIEYRSVLLVRGLALRSQTYRSGHVTLNISNIKYSLV